MNHFSRHRSEAGGVGLIHDVKRRMGQRLRMFNFMEQRVKTDCKSHSNFPNV